ncbi:hypothetical protein BDV12DRAFT_199950 [Aspergillus spectabilis]
MIESNLVNRISRKRPSDHLYVFGHEFAKGLYKVGSAKSIKRFDRHAIRYPGLVLYSFIYCPNAHLFEKQIQHEYSAHRYQHQCDAQRCATKTHGEWFKVPLQTLLNSITAWASFAQLFYGDDDSIDRSHLKILSAGVSQDTYRWTKWAQQQVEEWLSNSSSPQHSVLGGSGSEQHQEQNDNSPPSSPPELSSDLGTPTPGPNNLDPMTPPPNRERPSNQSKPLEPMVVVDDPFVSSMSMEKGRLEFVPRQPPQSYFNVRKAPSNAPLSPTRAWRGNETSILAPTRPNFANFAGVTGQVELSQERIESLNPLELADMVQRLYFS